MEIDARFPSHSSGWMRVEMDAYERAAAAAGTTAAAKCLEGITCFLSCGTH